MVHYFNSSIYLRDVVFWVQGQLYCRSFDKWLNLPRVNCPGIERVTGIHIGFPVVMFTLGKYGSSSGTGIGKHSGCTVVIASHGWQSRMESPTKPEWKINPNFLVSEQKCSRPRESCLGFWASSIQFTAKFHFNIIKLKSVELCYL